GHEPPLFRGKVRSLLECIRGHGIHSAGEERAEKVAMTDSESIDEIEERRICESCVGEDYLRAEIEREGNEAECAYCGDAGKTISIGELADHVGRAIEQHYVRTST